MLLRRLIALPLVLASLACSDSGGPDDDGTTKPPSDLTILRLSEASPPLFNPVESFYAVRGENREVRIFFQDEDDPNEAGDEYLRLRVDNDALLAYPDGTFVRGGRLGPHHGPVVDPDRLLFEFEPAGLTFSPERPAELKIHYDKADDDLDEDGDVDLEDETLELTLAIWRQESRRRSLRAARLAAPRRSRGDRRRARRFQPLRPGLLRSGPHDLHAFRRHLTAPAPRAGADRAFPGGPGDLRAAPAAAPLGPTPGCLPRPRPPGWASSSWRSRWRRRGAPLRRAGGLRWPHARPQPARRDRIRARPARGGGAPPHRGAEHRLPAGGQPARGPRLQQPRVGGPPARTARRKRSASIAARCSATSGWATAGAPRRPTTTSVSTYRQLADYDEAEKAVMQAVRHAESVGEPTLMALTSGGRAELRDRSGRLGAGPARAGPRLAHGRAGGRRHRGGGAAPHPGARRLAGATLRRGEGRG